MRHLYICLKSLLIYYFSNLILQKLISKWKTISLIKMYSSQTYLLLSQCRFLLKIFDWIIKKMYIFYFILKTPWYNISLPLTVIMVTYENILKTFPSFSLILCNYTNLSSSWRNLVLLFFAHKWGTMVKQKLSPLLDNIRASPNHRQVLLFGILGLYGPFFCRYCKKSEISCFCINISLKSILILIEICLFKK